MKDSAKRKEAAEFMKEIKEIKELACKGIGYIVEDAIATGYLGGMSHANDLYKKAVMGGKKNGTD